MDDDQNLAFISQLYPDVYTQILPQEGKFQSFFCFEFLEPQLNALSYKNKSGLVSLSEIFTILCCFQVWKPSLQILRNKVYKFKWAIYLSLSKKKKKSFKSFVGIFW